MREAVIVDSVRTPLAKSFRGSFNRTHPADLAAHAIREVVKRHPELDPSEIEDVIVAYARSAANAAAIGFDAIAS